MNTLIGRVMVVREEAAELIALGNEVLHTSDNLVKLVRNYVITEDARVLREYEAIVNAYFSFDGKFDRMMEIGMSDGEMRTLDSIAVQLDKLAAMEDQALEATADGRYDVAVSLVFGEEYTNIDNQLAALIETLMDDIYTRTNYESVKMTNEVRLGLIAIGVFFVLSMITFLLFTNWFVRKAFWYENILDHVPMPMSVTDSNMKWTFINKPVEDFLGLKRADVLGKHCSNWGANICNTENCGIRCLERGTVTSYFEQPGLNMDFQVDVAYLYDKKGSKTGHIEIVQDITEQMKGQKEDAEFVKELGDISISFVRAANDVEKGANDLSSNSAEQTGEVNQLSGSVSDVAEKTKANTILAGKSSELADTIKGNAEKGSGQMDQLAQAVADINSSIQSISKVFKFIDDIAFQTNILALNAAVEAARAGQHGKGFAVVAEEVRNLAAKSAASARDTDSLLASSVEKANTGVQIAGETAVSLKEIVSGIEESSLIAKQILSSSEEQNKLIEGINRGINQLAQGIQQNSAMAEESAAASTEMNDQAQHLQKLVDEFQSQINSFYG